MPREVDIARPGNFEEEDDSPTIKRAYGGYRSRTIVISDSDSDDELPSAASLLQFQPRKAAGPGPNLENRGSDDDIIDISSDSEVEETPMKSCPGKQLPAPVIPISSLSTTFKNAMSFDRDTRLESIQSKVNPCPDSTGASSQPAESSSTESEESDEKLFEDGDHPGILRFDPGPRRPALITSGSTSSISTPGTSDCSQDLWGTDTMPSASQTSDAFTSPTEEQSDDPFGGVKTPIKALKSPRRSGATGSAKATGSGYRSRVKERDDEDAGAAETPRPRPRPKPKARAANITLSSTPLSLSPKPTPRNRAKVLEAAAIALFEELNHSVFEGDLPKDCRIVWSKKLNTTAGRAHWKRVRGPGGAIVGHETHIELSTKVVDCEERVKNTLSHEMCHLGAWIFDGEIKPPHGAAFKRWSDRVMRARPDITISTCHSYEISYKYQWKCSTEACGKTYGRHSKSIDPEKQVCGVCRSKLVPLFATTPRRNAFQDYLKTHMKDFKAANPDMQHGDVMKRLGEMFRAEKEARVDEELDQVMAGMTRMALKPSAE